MALDIFKMVDTRKGLFAIEKVSLIYNLLTSILILFLYQRMDHPLKMLGDRALIAAMTFLLMYLYIGIVNQCFVHESLCLICNSRARSSMRYPLEVSNTIRW